MFYVPGHFDPVCEIDNNVSSLTQKFVNKALEIQSTAETYMRTQFANVLKKLSRESKLIQELSEEMIYQDDDDVNDDDETHNQAINTPLIDHIRRIRQKLDTYITEIPVLGYNSSKYDLNLIKSKLADCLNLSYSGKNFVVKKCNQYMCISNGELKFLDISNFVAPGFSYDMFIKSYEIELHKSFFPYEFLTSYDKLEHTQLPPYDSFFSSLKKVNVLEKEHARFLRLVDQEHHSVAVALKKINLKTPPLTGQANYQRLREI